MDLSAVNQGIEGDLIKMEGRPRREPLTGSPGGPLWEELSITLPNKESSTGKNKLQAPRGKDVHCISHKKSTTSVTPPMRNCHHPELLRFSSRLGSKHQFPPPQ